MPRYVTRAFYSAVDPHGQETHTADTLHEDDDAPKDTGLFDAMGNRIYRASDRAPLGFRMREKA